MCGANGELFEIGMRRVEQIVGFTSDDTGQCQHNRPRRLHPSITNGFSGRWWRFASPVRGKIVGRKGFDERVTKLERNCDVFERYGRVQMDEALEDCKRPGATGVNH